MREKNHVDDSLSHDLNILDPKLKIAYFIPHKPQDLKDASPFGRYSPGLLSTASILSHVAELPADVRELFSDRETILLLRLRRLIWRHVFPIETTSLQEFSRYEVMFLFRIIITNDAEVADVVDRIMFKDKIPFLHVSSIEGKNRLIAENLNINTLIEFVKSVLTHLSNISMWEKYVEAVRLLMTDDDRLSISHIPLKSGAHNVTAPNEIALSSFNWRLSGANPIVPIEKKDAWSSPQKYINRICLSADTVFNNREKLLKNIFIDHRDYRYILTVPSISWNHYQDWEKSINLKIKKMSMTLLNVAYKNTINQATYFDTFDNDQYHDIYKEDLFRSIIMHRSADQYCYTAGLSLLASATLAPVLRLEPKLNLIRKYLKILAHCVRYAKADKLQFKQSRLTKVVSQGMRDLIDQEFLKRIDRYDSEKHIQGIKIVADVPLELMLCHGLPLGLRYDLSRIPLLPSNSFIGNCVITPVMISADILLDILVIRSYQPDDPLSPILKGSILAILEGLPEAVVKNIKFIDVDSEKELIEALNAFSGAILIFDGHGNYEAEYGIGTFVIGGQPIEIWPLKYKCHFPPIVIFSACDTHPIDGSHGSCANAAFTLGAHTVLATTLPVDACWAALFIARLIYRIYEFVPVALKMVKILTWREVIGGMFRMTYVTEVTRILTKHENLKLSDEARDRIQLAANISINEFKSDWYETYLDVLSHECDIEIETLKDLVSRWASMTDVLKYIQLGSPENIIITKY